MDKDKKSKSDVGDQNDKKQPNLEKDKVTGVKVGELRNTDDDKDRDLEQQKKRQKENQDRSERAAGGR